MSLLENYVDRVRSVLEPLAAEARTIPADASLAVPKGRGAGLVLASDAVAELGSPEQSAAHLLLYSNTPAEDRVLLVGSDIESLSEQKVPFACVVILHGAGLTAEAYYQCVTRFPRYADLPGWQVRVAREKMWVRAAASDLGAPSFARAASTLIGRIKADFPAVETVQLWFVTGHESVVKALAAVAVEELEAARGIKENVWKERGFDYKSCQLAGHCGGCADKKTCASVRSMEARVKVHRRDQLKKE